MSSLSEIILEFRNNLQKDIDKAIDSATQRILFGLIETTIQDTHIGMRSIHESINNLNQQVKMLQESRGSGSRGATVIPEVYHTELKLSDAIEAVEADVDMTHDDDDDDDDVVIIEPEEKAVEEEEEAVEEEEVVEEEEEAIEEEEEEAVEEEEEDVDMTEDDDAPEGDVIDDTTVEQEDEGEAKEEEENGLRELEVDGTTYYYDAEGNVYQLDEDGEAAGPVGRYSEDSGEFELFEAEAEEETLEEFTYKGKTYYKDSQNNVYNSQAEPLPYSYVNGRLIKSTTEA